MGLSALGGFAAIFYLRIPLIRLAITLGQAVSPRLSRYCATGQYRAFTRLLMKLLASGVLLGAVVVAVAQWWGETLLRIVYGQEYAQHGQLLVLMLVGAAVYILAGLYRACTHGDADVAHAVVRVRRLHR